MTALYKLSTELQKINDELIENEGEMSTSLEIRLDETSLSFKEKSESIAKWTIDLNGDVAAINAEIERLQTKKRVTENLRKRLMEYIKGCMVAADVKKIESPTMTIRIQNNPASVEVLNETDIPSKYIKIKQITEIDKSGMLIALKAGEEIPGAKLIKDRNHLRIA